MRLKIVDGDRIGGYGGYGNRSYPEYEWKDPPEQLRDEFGRLRYRWDGEKPVLDPIPPTPEEKIEKEKREKLADLRAAYPQEKVLNLQDAAIRALADGQPLPKEYTDYTDFKASLNAIQPELGG